MRARGALLAVGALGLTFVALLQPQSAFAKDFTVDDPGYHPNSNEATARGECDVAAPEASPPIPPGCSLVAAIHVANFLGGASTITLPGGVYQLIDPQTGQAFATESIGVPMTIFGGGESSTTVNGGITSSGSYRLTVANLTTTQGGISGQVFLNRVTVNGGDTGVQIYGTGPSTLDHVTIKNTGNGGGIATGLGSGAVIIKNAVVSGSTGPGMLLGENFPATVSDSEVSGAFGVGISAVGAVITSTKVHDNQGVGIAATNSTVNLVTVTNNQGGMSVTKSSLLFTTITNNTATGPVGVGGITVLGTSSLAEVTITGNKGAVGGLRSFGAGTVVTLGSNVRIENNTGSAAGGISNENGALLTLFSTSVSNNTSTGGAGGIRNQDATILLRSATVNDNTAAQAGGGLINTGTRARVESTDDDPSALTADFSENTAPTGAGIFNDGGTMILKRVSVDNNTATTAGGAAGILTRLGIVTINDTKIRTNTGTGIKQIGGNTTGNGLTIFSSSGAGIETTTDATAPSARANVSLNASHILQNLGGGFINRGAAGSIAQIVGSLIRQNQQSGSQALAGAPSGSGIANGELNTLTITDSAVEGNSGGSGAVANGGNATLTRVSISGNAGTGFVNAATAGTTALSAVTISGNNGAGGPGGLQALGALTLTGVTITANTGGGVGSSANALRLKSSIIANNGGPNCQGAPTSLGHNLSSDISCPFNAGNGDVIGVDPLLGPLGGPSGKPQTHALQPGSPAIDAGDNADCANTPLDGNGDGTVVCDIGAFEAPDLSGGTCSPRPNVVVAATNNRDGRLRVTVSSGRGSIRTIDFGAAANALVEIPGTTSGTAGNFTFTPPANTGQVTFYVRRATAGSAATVQVIVTDGCGPWRSFVGGGPAAF
ncbi:MAG: right-handed parallel beta-helix repeat-containing protein [Chloroflexota bacterium]|mgnify:CR=1 FL=1